MRFKGHTIIVALLLSILLNSCSSNELKIGKTKLMVKGASGWDVQYLLNGEPAFIGFGEYYTDVTPFSLNGVNRLIIEGKQYSSNCPRLSDAQIYSLQGSNKNLIKSFSSKVGEKSYHAEMEFEFNTGRKVWEISEDLAEISVKDRELISAAIENFENVLKSADIDSLKAFDMYNWDLENNRPQKGIDKNLIKLLSPLLINSQYHIESTPFNELSISKGVKLVLLYNQQGFLFRIKPKDSYIKKGEWYAHFTILRLYFIKMNGNWEMMHLLDDNLIG